MAQRKPIAGRRSCVLYAVILAALALIVAGAGLVLVVRPELDRRRQAEVRLEQAETHYQAGVAFQNMGDWEAAEAEFKQAIALAPDYKDAQTRLAEVKARLAQSEATATAEAIAQAEQAWADAQATATAQAQATATAQAVAATATMDAVETHYQKGLAYINLEKWAEAQVELQAVFEVDPNYKDVQAQLAVVDSEVVKLTPTATPTPLATPTNTPAPSTYTVRMYDIDDEVTLYINEKPVYKAKWAHHGVEPDWYNFGHKPGDSGEIDITSMLKSGTNSLRFELWNKAVCCSTALSIQVKNDGQTIFSDAFRKSDSSSGIKYNKTLTIAIP